MRNLCVYTAVILALLLVVVIGGFPRPVKGDGGWVTGTPRECDQVPIATATQAPECYPTTATPAPTQTPNLTTPTPTRAGGEAGRMPRPPIHITIDAQGVTRRDDK
jgi:hypothetical protein